MIRIWQAYQCNNSGSHRLIARFADAMAARAAGEALTALVTELTPADSNDRRSAFEALARRYGFETWEDDGWGGPEDGPHVVVHEATLIVHHAYCLGFGPGVPAFLTERGAMVEAESWDAVHVSLVFRCTRGVDPILDDELAEFGEQAQPPDREVEKLTARWVGHPARGKVAYFRDAGTVGMYFPIDPRDLANMRAWLVERGIDEPIITIEPAADRTLFIALAAARCTACNGPLEYLDPRLHDIETPQLVCKPCGGLYDLATFLWTPT